MIDKNDFINALGQPDKGFNAAAEQALDAIRATGSAARPQKRRTKGAAFAVAAVFVIAMISGALFFGPKKPMPDRVAAPGKPPAATADPKVTPEPTPPQLPTPRPTPQQMATPEPTPSPMPQQQTTPEPTPMSLTEFFASAVTGGADEPASILVTGEGSAVTDSIHGELFLRAFGSPYDMLYPNHGNVRFDTGIRSVNGQVYDCMELHIQTGAGEICALALTSGEAENSDEDGDAEEALTLWADMHDDISQTDSFMINADALAAYIYDKSCAKVCDIMDNGGAAWNEYALNGVKVTFDGDLRPIVYQLFFGSDCEVCIRWACDPETGSVSFGNSYTGDFYSGYFGGSAAERPEPTPPPMEAPQN